MKLKLDINPNLVARMAAEVPAANAPIFLPVPQGKLPKRLDLARDADRALDGVPGLIVANWGEGQTGWFPL